MFGIKKHFGLLAVIFLSFWAIRPLFVSGFFSMHDDTQVARVFEMGKALQDGMLPVRWAQDLGYGYGYPIFNFYAPLAYYFGGILTLFGIDALVATKIMIGFATIVAGIFMYFLAREFFGKIGGIVSALFYMYAPYHAVQIYVRGAVGELWAYAFIPLVFYGLYMQYEKPRWKYIVFGSLGFAGVILSHNLTAMMLTPFLIVFILLQVYVLIKKKQLYAIRYTPYAIVLGLLLSAFYWLPALLEMHFTNVQSQVGGGADFRDHFACLSQLWDSAWGFGGSIPGCIDGLSFKLGKLHIIASMLTFLISLFFGRKIVWFLFGGFFISIFFMTEASRPIWEVIPFMAFLQYPWRFLLFASFFSSLLAGAIVWFLEQKFRKTRHFNTILYLSTGVLIFFLLYFNIKLFQPQTLLHKTYLDYTNEYYIKWTASKISDEYLPTNVKTPRSWVDIPKENLNEKSVVVTVKNHRDLFFNYKDQLPPLRFKQTNIEKIANMTSAIGIVILIIGIIYIHRRRQSV